KSSWRDANIHQKVLLYCRLFRDLVPHFYDDLYISRIVSSLYIAVLWRKGVFVVGTQLCGEFPLFFLILCGCGVFLYYAISLRLSSSMNKKKRKKKKKKVLLNLYTNYFCALISGFSSILLFFV